MKKLGLFLISVSLFSVAQAREGFNSSDHCQSRYKSTSSWISDSCKMFIPNQAAVQTALTTEVKASVVKGGEVVIFGKSASQLIKSKTGTAEELAATIKGLSDLVVPPSLTDSQDVINQKTAKRVNDDYKKRFNTVYLLARLMDTYKDIHPEVVSDSLDSLALVAQLDWYSKTRRLAMIAYVGIQKDSSMVEKLLKDIHSSDGLVVFNGDFDRSGLKAEHLTAFNASGEVMYVVDLPNRVSTSYYWKGASLSSYKRFRGTRPEIENEIHRRIPLLLESLDQAKVEVLARLEADEYRMYRHKERDEKALPALDELREKLESNSVYELKVDRLLSDTDEYGNGVTKVLSDNTREWAQQIYGQLHLEDSLSFDQLLDDGIAMDYFDTFWELQLPLEQ